MPPDRPAPSDACSASFWAGKSPMLEACHKGDAERVRALIASGEPVNPAFDADAARTRATSVFGPGGTFEAGMAALLAGLPENDPLRATLAAMPPEVEETRLSLTRQLHQETIERLATGPSSWEIPLFVAAESGSAECVRLLLAAGARAGQLDSQGHTALFAAGSPEVVRVLAGAGVDLLVTDGFNRDALRERLEAMGDDQAANERVAEVCAALIEAGVPLVRAIREGSSRLYEAAFVENLHAVRFLLRAGHPALDDGAALGSALHAICWHWDHGDERDEATRGIVQALLDAGITTDNRDRNGNTPLHEAVAGDGVNLVAAEVLLRTGADINAQNDEGQTPLVYHYEYAFEYNKAVPFLVAKGANPLIANARGKNAIDVARQMIAGRNPDWREGMTRDDGEEMCGWKGPATPGDGEHALLDMMLKAAERFRR